MAGSNGTDQLASVRARGSRPALVRRSTWTRPAPVLHDDIGWVDFGPAGSSYYYSRPRMAATGDADPRRRLVQGRGQRLVRPPVGRLHLGRRRRLGLVRVNLADGTDLTLSVVRDRDGSASRSAYGTLGRPDGRCSTSTSDAFTVDRDGDAGRARAPARSTRPAWRIAVPAEGLAIELAPTRRRPGARHAGDDRRRVLGGLAGRRGTRTARGRGEAYVELTARRYVELTALRANRDRRTRVEGPSARPDRTRSDSIVRGVSIVAAGVVAPAAALRRDLPGGEEARHASLVARHRCDCLAGRTPSRSSLGVYATAPGRRVGRAPSWTSAAAPGSARQAPAGAARPAATSWARSSSRRSTSPTSPRTSRSTRPARTRSSS